MSGTSAYTAGVIAGRTLAAAAVGGVLAVAGLVAANEADIAPISATETVEVFADTIANTQYQGVCAVVTPPDPDPCDAVNGTLRYTVLGSLERNTYYPKWVAANPGEVARLAVVMATPVCSIPSTPQPQVMFTEYGAALAAIMQAVACARHPEPITWPPLPPALSPTRSDKTPPSAPGPLTVTP